MTVTTGITEEKPATSPCDYWYLHGYMFLTSSQTYTDRALSIISQYCLTASLALKRECNKSLDASSPTMTLVLYGLISLKIDVFEKYCISFII